MGVPPYLIASGLRGVISQRLLRRICTSCKTEYVPPKKALELAKMPDIPGKIYWHGVGCDRCFHSGYRGRIGVFEVMTIQEGLRRCIMEGQTARSLWKWHERKAVISPWQNMHRKWWTRELPQWMR